MIDVSAGANTRGVYYGISQGGIMGGALMAHYPGFRLRGARRAGNELLKPAAPVGRFRHLLPRRPGSAFTRTTPTNTNGRSYSP